MLLITREGQGDCCLHNAKGKQEDFPYCYKKPICIKKPPKMIVLSAVYDKPKHQQYLYTALHHRPAWGELSGLSHAPFPASFVPGCMIQAGRGTAHSQPIAALPELSTTVCQHQLKRAALLKAALRLPRAGKAEGSPSPCGPKPLPVTCWQWSLQHGAGPWAEEGQQYRSHSQHGCSQLDGRASGHSWARAPDTSQVAHQSLQQAGMSSSAMVGFGQGTRMEEWESVLRCSPSHLHSGLRRMAVWGRVCGKEYISQQSPNGGQILKLILTDFQGVRMGSSKATQPTVTLIPAEEEVSLGDTNHPDLKALTPVPLIQSENVLCRQKTDPSQLFPRSA